MHKRQERVQSAARLLTIARHLYVGKPGKHGFVGYDLRKAMVYAKRALMFEPSCYEALILAGHIVGELDESEEGLRRALDYYLRARRVCPSDPDSYGSEARALGDVGQAELAEQPARKAWRLTLDDPSADDFDLEVACIELRDILVAQKKWEAASRVLEAGLIRVPGSDWLRRVLELTHKKIDWEESTASSLLKRVK
jgi:tetratricopeptide (TPR) repeat protein